MQKIVISSNTAWSIYNFRLNLAKELKNKGYEIIIVAPYDKYAEELKKIFFEGEDVETTIWFILMYQIWKENWFE